MLMYPNPNSMLRKGLWFFLSLFIVTACKTTQPPVSTTQTPIPTPVVQVASVQQDPVVMSVGGKPVMATEFMQVYKKNILANDSANADKGIREYLDLYTNFKLKVVAAEKDGRDTTEAFREELAGYRKQLAQPYLTEKNVSEALVKEVYERMKEEVDASHILIACAPEAEPKDTLEAYKEAMMVREKVLAGEDFTQLAHQYSKDPSVVSNGGNLKYFTALQMVYSFETAAYQTAKGKVSMPIRSQFGYHLIKVIDRRDARAKLKVAHITTNIKPNATAEEKIAAKQKIDEIFERLKKGESFEKLCKEYSEDPTSRNNNGELPIFGTGQMVEPFEVAAFSLTEKGEISSPVQTVYGWHIIKLLDKKPLEPYSEMSNFIRQKIQTDPRSNVGKAALVKRLKKENGFVENVAIVQEIIAKADTSLFKNKWSYNTQDDLAKKVLFSIGKKETLVKEFFESVKQLSSKGQTAYREGSPTVLMRHLYERFADAQIIQYEDGLLETKYPEFKSLMQEYRDGILLFQMMETNVWQKSVEDTTGLTAFFNQNRSKYMMPVRVYAMYLSASSKETLEQAKQTMAQNPYPLSRKLNDMLFDKNQAALTAEHKEKLFDLIVILSKNPDYRVEIIGNTDPSEKDTISAARAKNVIKYLVENRVAMSRLIEKDNGKFKPISRTERNRNQRVAFGFYTTARQDVEKQFNAEKPDQLTVLQGYFKKGDNKVIDGLDWNAGVQTFEKSGRYYQIDIKKVDAPRQKNIDEARGTVINDYQAFLEKEWLSRLKKEFPVSVNEEEVKKLMK